MAILAPRSWNSSSGFDSSCVQKLLWGNWILDERVFEKQLYPQLIWALGSSSSTSEPHCFLGQNHISSYKLEILNANRKSNKLYTTWRVPPGAPSRCRAQTSCSYGSRSTRVRVLHVFKGEPYRGILEPLPRIPLLDLITTISRVA